VLLPGATYVSLAVEAAKEIAASAAREIELLEVGNMDLLRPVVVPDNKDGVEAMFTAGLIDDNASARQSDSVKARFSYSVTVADNMVHTCTGELVVNFGKVSKDAAILPPRDAAKENVVGVDCDRVYGMFEDVGLHYTGPFHTMAESSRSLNYCVAKGVWEAGQIGDNLIIHPAVLDVAFQSLLVARAHPASRQITTALLPSHIDRVRISPYLPQKTSDNGLHVDFESWTVDQTMSSMVGDLNLYESDSGRTLAQVEGLQLRIVGEQDASQDKQLFAKTVWERDIAHGFNEDIRNTEKDAQLLRLTEDLERVALYYARRLADETPASDWSKFEWYHQRMLAANAEHLESVKRGQHPVLRKEWLSDGPEILEKMAEAHPDDVKLSMLNALGSNYPNIVRGKMSQMEVMTKDDLLSRCFIEDQSCTQTNQLLAKALRQITFKYPRSNILEINAGTVGTVSNPDLHLELPLERNMATD